MLASLRLCPPNDQLLCHWCWFHSNEFNLLWTDCSHCCRRWRSIFRRGSLGDLGKCIADRSTERTQGSLTCNVALMILKVVFPFSEFGLFLVVLLMTLKSCRLPIPEPRRTSSKRLAPSKPTTSRQSREPPVSYISPPLPNFIFNAKKRAFLGFRMLGWKRLEKYSGFFWGSCPLFCFHAILIYGYP